MVTESMVVGVELGRDCWVFGEGGSGLRRKLRWDIRTGLDNGWEYFMDVGCI